jgi:hypothetical protein
MTWIGVICGVFLGNVLYRKYIERKNPVRYNTVKVVTDPAVKREKTKKIWRVFDIIFGIATAILLIVLYLPEMLNYEFTVSVNSALIAFEIVAVIIIVGLYDAAYLLILTPIRIITMLKSTNN